LPWFAPEFNLAGQKLENPHFGGDSQMAELEKGCLWQKNRAGVRTDKVFALAFPFKNAILERIRRLRAMFFESLQREDAEGEMAKGLPACAMLRRGKRRIS
jgi:hypothetical protein